MYSLQRLCAIGLVIIHAQLLAMDTLSGEISLEPKSATVTSGNVTLTVSQDTWFFCSNSFTNEIRNMVNPLDNDFSKKEKHELHINDNCSLSVGTLKYTLKTPCALTTFISDCKPGNYRKETTKGLLGWARHISINETTTTDELSFKFSYEDGKSAVAKKKRKQQVETLSSDPFITIGTQVQTASKVIEEDIQDTEQIGKGYSVLQSVVELAKKYELEK